MFFISILSVIFISVLSFTMFSFKFSKKNYIIEIICAISLIFCEICEFVFYHKIFSIWDKISIIAWFVYIVLIVFRIRRIGFDE